MTAPSRPPTATSGVAFAIGLAKRERTRPVLPAATSVALALLLACGPAGTTSDSPGSTGPGTTTHTRTTRRADCSLAPTGCHEVAECHGRGICESAPPSSDVGCGIPPRVVEACKSDSDCKTGEVCNSFAIGCERGRRCEPRCETAGCQGGWACRGDGRCSALRCPGEWNCADYGACRPPAAGEGPLQGGRDWHGCVPLSCSRDDDCPCAHCVNSTCTPIPGRCIEPRG